jgi:hypothetical protein
LRSPPARRFLSACCSALADHLGSVFAVFRYEHAADLLERPTRQMNGYLQATGAMARVHDYVEQSAVRDMRRQPCQTRFVSRAGRSPVRARGRIAAVRYQQPVERRSARAGTSTPARRPFHDCFSVCTTHWLQRLGGTICAR